nr:hypothetical protein [Clostridium botulinum]
MLDIKFIKTRKIEIVVAKIAVTDIVHISTKFKIKMYKRIYF